MKGFAWGHTAILSDGTQSSSLLVLGCSFQIFLLSGAYICSSFLGRSSASHFLLTSQLLQELLLLGQMVPLPPPAPQQYLRIKINHPVLFSCCAN